MDKLLILNLILVAIIAIGLILVKKYVKREFTQSIILIATSIVTILFHYSSFIIKLFSGDDAMGYLSNNPNVGMWSALIFGVLKNKKSKFATFMVDYLFWFGIVSTLVGMFANVDFIKNPTLANYENVKSIVSHATLLFNVLLLVIFKYVKVNVIGNITNIMISVVEMAILGGYCTLALWALRSKEFAFYKNSMFLLHSPFEGLDFLTYPIIVLIAIPIYFAVFVICDLIAHKKGERFFDKIRAKRRGQLS